MNFRNAIERFKTDYRVICLANGIKELKLGEEEILLYLSKAYSALSFTERLVEKTDTVQLVSGQYEYKGGSGATNFPLELLDITQVRFNDGGSTMTILNEVSFENMPVSQRPSGIPTAWTMYGVGSGRSLFIDSTPDQSYTATNGYVLTLHYREKIFIYSGTADGSFTGLDLTSATGGGSFANPEEWDDLIVSKAIAKVLPVGIKGSYVLENEQAEMRLRQTKPLVIEEKLPYYL